MQVIERTDVSVSFSALLGILVVCRDQQGWVYGWCRANVSWVSGLGFLLLNVASPLFSCITGTKEKEEVWEAAYSDWWHTFHPWVPERSPGKLTHQHRGVKKHGLCGKSDESSSWKHVSDFGLPPSHKFPQCWEEPLELYNDVGRNGVAHLRFLTCWNGMPPQRKTRS